MQHKARKALATGIAIISVAASAATAGAGTTGSGSTSGQIDSGGAATTFNTTRTTTGSGDVSIKQTSSTQSSATAISFRNCADTATVVAARTLTDGATKTWPTGSSGVCYRLRMYRSNPKDTNGWGFGSGVTTVNLTLS